MEIFKRNTQKNSNSTGRPFTIYHLTREPIKTVSTEVGKRILEAFWVHLKILRALDQCYFMKKQIPLALSSSNLHAEIKMKANQRLDSQPIYLSYLKERTWIITYIWINERPKKLNG